MQRAMGMDGQSHAFADCIPGENCGMGIDEHIQIWRGMIIANIDASLLGFLAALLFIGLLTQSIALLHLQATTQISPYERHHKEWRLYQYLILLFSRGILQPKIFA